MKRKITLYVFALFSISVSAQIYTPGGVVNVSSSGNAVGIGINTPSDLLTVYGSHGDTRIHLQSYGGGYDVNKADLMLWASEPGLTYSGAGIGNNVHNFNTVTGGIHLLNPARGGSYIRLLDNFMTFNVLSVNGTDKQVVTINPQGNLGIDTENPSTKLEVTGSSQVGYELGSFKLKSGTANQFMYFGYDDQYLAGYIQSVKPGTAQQNLLLAPVGGNVGIGTKSPDAKLAVNGTVHSQEVRVDMTGWSDFVFKEEYILPTLEQVEKHIKEKGHLEHIPSEAEVLRDGINLGEMNSKLLQKIEEMTLYMIEMKKDISALKVENEALRSMIGNK